MTPGHTFKAVKRQSTSKIHLARPLHFLSLSRLWSNVTCIAPLTAYVKCTHVLFKFDHISRFRLLHVQVKEGRKPKHMVATRGRMTRSLWAFRVQGDAQGLVVIQPIIKRV